MSWKKAALVVLDGFGCAPKGRGNAIELAATPALDRLFERYPHTLLDASGMAVGLPEGQQGNSEVGHLTIGAGRVVLQDLTRISQAIRDESFFRNPVLTAAVEAVRERGTTLHLLGLISPGGVHSHQDHVAAVCELAFRHRLQAVVVHAFTDGRDTPTDSGAGFVGQLEARLAEIGVGRVGSVGGRYFAMDRDGRWNRLERAYLTLLGHGQRRCEKAVPYIEESYRQGKSDEFIEPASVVASGERPAGIRPGDVVVHCNFRPDRAREICHALVNPEFGGFHRDFVLDPGDLITFTSFDDNLPAKVAFPKPVLADTLGDVVAATGARQFHVAETEKYAHVTYFIDGGREQPLAGEERLLIPSSKVATYDLQPEMSAPAIADAVVAHMEAAEVALILVNFANADMVGHTGNLDATIKAVECLDRCLARISQAAAENGYTLLITADHGNAEQMLSADGTTPLTSHTTNQVPLLVTDVGCSLRGGGGLRDVAPTLLAGMGIPSPESMTGTSLLGPA